VQDPDLIGGSEEKDFPNPVVYLAVVNFLPSALFVRIREGVSGRQGLGFGSGRTAALSYF